MENLLVFQHSYLIPLLPLVGAAIAGFFGSRWLKGQSHWPIWIAMGIGAVMSIILFVQMLGLLRDGQPVVATLHLFDWIRAGNFIAQAKLIVDPLTMVMLLVVTCIGLVIAVFSRGYMLGEEGYFRFFAYMGIFIFAMVCVIMGENLVMLYLGWEAVGLASYLLIGYYYERPAAREAAKKAFLVNRVGDFGFGLGIMLTFYAFGTVSYYDGTGGVDGFLTQIHAIAMGLQEATPQQEMAMFWVPFLLLMGAFGKSAQFPLYVWLPDAMEGPTPVSALIHAATMVTSGVYMVVRCSPMYVDNPYVMTTLAVIAAFTAIFAATIALRQFDLKKVFAFSTVSQLGLMFVGVAALAPVAGMFHLINHAFFKALLFLSSGVVMHAMAGELDIRRMSGLKRQLPWTRWCMLIGCCALAGVIPFSGFWSKDEIIISAFDRSVVWGVVMLFMALLTAYYAFRVYFRVFEGPEVIPAAAGGHGHEADEAIEPHAAASAAAVQTGTEYESGVDKHLRRDTVEHPSPDHGHGHAHGHGEDHHHNHEPWIMIAPLILLAIGAFAAGILNIPFHWLGDFLGQSPAMIQGMEVLAMRGTAVDPAMWGHHGEYELWWSGYVVAASILVPLLGIFLAYQMHLADRRRAERAAARVPWLARTLEARYWVDEAYLAFIVAPLRKVGRIFFGVDRIAINGLVWSVSFVPQLSGFALKLSTQRGYLQGYAALMLLGIAVILLVVFVFV